MEAEKEHRKQRREAIKAQKALTQPPRLGKLKYQKTPVQVSRDDLTACMFPAHKVVHKGMYCTNIPGQRCESLCLPALDALL